MSQGHKSAWQTVLLTAKDRAALAKTVVSVLPAFVYFATDGECPEEWFDDTRDHIIATTEFLTDTDGNFNGKIRTAADEEALALLGEDSGFGIQGFEIEGLELLDQTEATISVAQPWDQVSTGTAKDPQDFGQRPTFPTARGDDDSLIASDSSHAQQEKGSVTTPVHGQKKTVMGGRTDAPELVMAHKLIISRSQYMKTYIEFIRDYQSCKSPASWTVKRVRQSVVLGPATLAKLLWT